MNPFRRSVFILFASLCLWSGHAGAEEPAPPDIFLAKLCYHRALLSLELSNSDYGTTASAMNELMKGSGVLSDHLTKLYNGFLSQLEKKSPAAYKHLGEQAQKDSVSEASVYSQKQLNEQLNGLTLREFIVRGSAYEVFQRLFYKANRQGRVCTYNSEPIFRSEAKLRALPLRKAASEISLLSAKEVVEMIVQDYIQAVQPLQESHHE